LDGGQQSECGSTQLGWGERGDRGVLGGFGAADPDAGQDERGGEDGDRRPGGGEQEVSEQERGDPGGGDEQWSAGAELIGEPAGGNEVSVAATL
jgi:hypothetical protein